MEEKAATEGKSEAAALEETVPGQGEVDAGVSNYAAELQEERNSKANWRPKARRYRRPEEAYNLFSGQRFLQGL